MRAQETSRPRGLVLIHGLGRSWRSMLPLERAGAKRGYSVLNMRYATRAAPIMVLAESLADAVEGFVAGERLDFATHSLGGIVLRAAVASGFMPIERVGRVVMLAPPNRGSEIVDYATSKPALRAAFRRVFGPAGSQLGTSGRSALASLGDPEFDFAVIAGTRSLNPFSSRLITGANDGKVSVARASHPRMRALLVVPHTHTFLMRAPVVIRETFHYLENGRFSRQRADTTSTSRT